MKKIAILAASAALFAAAPALAADLGSEITTAATHAGLAAKASDLDGVHMHLHHALNCLVGPNGNGFDAKQMNPCAGSGTGAIPDASDPAMKQALENAADTARAGIAASDIAAAKADANKANAQITAAK
ncbi:MAG TPA: hypothetical protein VIJ72_05765 [Rhizomicrobium sp.]